MPLDSNSSATLSSDGYVGTYLVIPAGGATVNLDVNATEGSGSVAPHLNISIANSNLGFAVSSSSATDYDTSSLTLAAGTYLVSVQRDYSGNTANTTPFTVNSLSVNTTSGGGATLSNTNTDANALAAANTYISNYRQGPANVAITGPSGLKLLPGTPVSASMTRNAFNFGSTVPDTVSTYLTSNPAVGSTAYNFQQYFNQNFNTMVPENAGKWGEDEATQTTPTSSAKPTMSNIDLLLSYAQSHDMTVRMHNLIWGSGSTSGSQQPSWVDTLISGAAGGNATDKTELSTAISNRIDYYVGDTNPADVNYVNSRASEYQQIDVLNEPIHNPSYLNIYGASGIANIYNQVATAAASVGNSSLQLFTNEYNVLQYSTNSSGQSDPYANWYRQYVESIRNAGGNVGGIGMEFYSDGTTSGSNTAASPSRYEEALANLAVDGLPISLSEFGVKTGVSSAVATTIMQDAMTMMFGDPQAENFVMWDWWLGNFGNTADEAAALYNSNWTLTTVGTAYQALMSQWTTNLTGSSAPTVDANGNINFNGFYGNYNIGGGSIALAQGTTNYNLSLSAPPDWSIWKAGTSSNWSGGGNWSSGGVADAAGQTAYFGNNATATTVTVDSPQTVGMIAFDSSGSYTIAGSSLITLQGFNVAAGHAAEIYVVSGSHAISAPLQMLDNTTVTVAAGNSALTISDLQSSTATLTKAGVGLLSVNAVNASGLTVTGGVLQILPNGSSSGASAVSALSLAAGATLDLTNNSIAVNYTGASPLGALSADIAAAYDAGRWDMPGITSSTAANSGDYALGIIDNGSQVKIAYTLVGDANLDGFVDGSDLAMIQANGTTWSQGDFNYDGQVNADDYALFMLGVSESATLGRAVPEPAVLGAWTGLMVITFRRTKVGRL